MTTESNNFVEPICKNCNHPIPLHKPTCSFEEDDNKNDVCGCQNARYYNTLISAEYIGWEEIHCNSCGALTSYIDSPLEDVSEFTILCPKCISKNNHGGGEANKI